MIIHSLSTDRREEVSASYGLRLIEQGKAIAVKPSAARKTAKRDAAKQVSQDAAQGHD